MTFGAHSYLESASNWKLLVNLKDVILTAYLSLKTFWLAVFSQLASAKPAITVGILEIKLDRL